MHKVHGDTIDLLMQGDTKTLCKVHSKREISIIEIGIYTSNLTTHIWCNSCDILLFSDENAVPCETCSASCCEHDVRREHSGSEHLHTHTHTNTHGKNTEKRQKVNVCAENIPTFFKHFLHK